MKKIRDQKVFFIQRVRKGNLVSDVILVSTKKMNKKMRFLFAIYEIIRNIRLSETTHVYKVSIHL